MSLFPVPNPSYADLMTVQIQSISQDPLYRAAAKSWAYYTGQAYDPRFGLTLDSPYADWHEEIDGRRPACQLLGRIIIDSSAEFLFGNTPRFNCPNNTKVEEELQKILDANDVDAKLFSLAVQAGNEGSVWARFSWTPHIAERPVAISWLSPYEVKVFRDPLDDKNVRKVRVQQKYQDEVSKKWYLYREEWTTEEYLVYRTLETDEYDDTKAISQMVGSQWPVDRTEVNRFGVIPLLQIYNQRVLAELDGKGDIWDFYPLLNTYSHTRHLENRSNQWDGDPITAFVNCDTVPAQLNPGDIMNLQGDNARIDRLIPQNNLRQWMQQYCMDVERDLFDASGQDRLNPAEITNKGNMTRAVMEMVFRRSVQSVLMKQKNWGKMGLVRFFSMMFQAIARLQDAQSFFPAIHDAGKDPKNTKIVVKWPPLFKITPEERSALLTDMTIAISNGFLTRERAIELAAEAFSIEDVDELKEELMDWEPATMDSSQQASDQQSGKQKNGEEDTLDG